MFKNISGSLVLSIVMFFLPLETTYGKTAQWSVHPDTPMIGFDREILITGDEAFESFYRSKREASEKIYLYINGLRIDTADLRLVIPAQESENDTVQESDIFAIYISRDNLKENLWSSIRVRSTSDPAFTRQAYFGFGNKEQIEEIATKKLKFSLVSKIRLMSAALVLAILVLIFGIASINSNILRAGQALPGERPPVSLARTQMALWLFVIVTCFISIWIINDDFNTLNSTVLVLLGISAGTYLSASLIDGTDHSSAGSFIDATDVPLSVGIRKKEKHWLLQLLSDNNGVTLHRFQILAWTLVMVVVFLSDVILNLQMPTFDSQVLGVMGISSGTYLGFKFPELKKQDQND